MSCEDPRLSPVPGDVLRPRSGGGGTLPNRDYRVLEVHRIATELGERVDIVLILTAGGSLNPSIHAKPRTLRLATFQQHMRNATVTVRGGRAVQTTHAESASIEGSSQHLRTVHLAVGDLVIRRGQGDRCNVWELRHTGRLAPCADVLYQPAMILDCPVEARAMNLLEELLERYPGGQDAPGGWAP